MSKCEGCKKYDDCRTGSGLVWPCGAFVSKNPMTNADRIRAMTDEELAVVIACPYDVEDYWLCERRDCIACCVDWLKRPCGGADHE